MPPPANERTYAEWIESRKDLTEDDLLAIDILTQGLIEARAPGKSKKPTSKEKTFTEWTEMFNILTEEDVSAIDALTQALIKPKEKPPPPVEELVSKLETFVRKISGFFDPKPLAPGETTTDRWMANLKKLSQQEAKDFEAEIKYVEARIKELGWDKPDTPAKLKKELELKKPPPPPPPKKPTVKPELLIKRTPYPKWWRDSLNAKIDLTAPGSAILATVSGNLRLFVATIVITVTGETVITISFGSAGSSGPIYLGGSGQPMGFVIAMGNSPAPCGSGSLTITATDPNAENPSIGGFATCFALKEKE